MFKQMLNETIKVNEDSLQKAMSQIKYNEEKEPEVAAADAAIEVPVTDAPVAEEKPLEVTPELVTGLIAKLPELEGIDPVKLEVGMKNEMKFVELLGGNMENVAKLAAAHIKEFPEADYYEALSAMEASLVPPPVEEKPATEAPVAEEKPVEAPVESEVEEAKKKKKKDEDEKKDKKEKK